MVAGSPPQPWSLPSTSSSRPVTWSGRPDRADGRRNIVSLTAAGRRQLHRLDRALERTQERFLAPLTARDRARYTELVRALLDHHEATAAG